MTKHCKCHECKAEARNESAWLGAPQAAMLVRSGRNWLVFTKRIVSGVKTFTQDTFMGYAARSRAHDYAAGRNQNPHAVLIRRGPMEFIEA